MGTDIIFCSTAYGGITSLKIQAGNESFTAGEYDIGQKCETISIPADDCIVGFGQSWYIDKLLDVSLQTKSGLLFNVEDSMNPSISTTMDDCLSGVHGEFKRDIMSGIGWV